jgi:hypothetical protein
MLRPKSISGLSESRVSVLDCASPLPLLHHQSCGGRAARAAAVQNLAELFGQTFKLGYSFIETDLISQKFQNPLHKFIRLVRMKPMTGIGNSLDFRPWKQFTDQRHIFRIEVI